MVASQVITHVGEGGREEWWAHRCVSPLLSSSGEKKEKEGFRWILRGEDWRSECAIALKYHSEPPIAHRPTHEKCPLLRSVGRTDSPTYLHGAHSHFERGLKGETGGLSPRLLALVTPAAHPAEEWHLLTNHHHPNSRDWPICISKGGRRRRRRVPTHVYFPRPPELSATAAMRGGKGQSAGRIDRVTGAAF